jgi:hypothetical protein
MPEDEPVKPVDASCPPSGSTFGSVVRTGLALIPAVGGALATAWAEWDTTRRFNRVEEAVGQLRRFIEERKISADKLGEAEMHLLEDGLNRISREHRKDKRSAFVRLIASCWLHPETPFEEREAFLRALDEFSNTHIRVLASLRDHREKDSPKYDQIADSLFSGGFDKTERDSILVPVMERLASGFGFIERAYDFSYKGDGGIIPSKRMSPETIAKWCEHRITPLGLRFLNFIECPPPQLT